MCEREDQGQFVEVVSHQASLSWNSRSGWYGQILFSRCRREYICSLDILRSETGKISQDRLGGIAAARLASTVRSVTLVPRKTPTLALGIRKETLIICSADLIGLFYDDVLTIRRIFQQSAPAPSFLVVASGLRLYFLFFGLLDDSRFLVTYSRTAETELNLNTETLTRQLSGVASEPQEDSTQSRSPTRR